MLRPDRKDETYRNGKLGGVRQWIESVNRTLKGHLGLEEHEDVAPTACSPAWLNGYWPMAAGLWHNWTTGATSKCSLTAWDH